jgi:hypothetical protein
MRPVFCALRRHIYRRRGLIRRKRLRAPVVIMVLIVAVGAAQAQSLRVAGRAGYVSEWELNGEATQTTTGSINDFAAQLTLKHLQS